MSKILSYDLILSEDVKKSIKKDYTENLLSIREIKEKYKINSSYYIHKLLGNLIRSFSEATKIAHKKHPESYKHTDECKKIMREKRLKWMKEHPEQTAWRLKNMSYPEKCFQKILEDNGLDKKYLIYREYSVFPYFIDFAFINEKIAVEIDGSQHLLKERKERDDEKDKLLTNKGWKILRIAATEVTHDGTKALQALLSMLDDKNINYDKVGILKAPKKSKIKKVGILKAPKTYVKPKRGADGKTDKEREAAFKQRKVKWPTKEELSKLLEISTFKAIGRQYGVCGNSVKKWAEKYGIYEKRINPKIVKCPCCGKEFKVYGKSKQKYCSIKCFTEYAKKHKLFSINRGFNFIYKINEDGTFTNKRVKPEEIESYINNGWMRGRILNNLKNNQ